MADRGDIMPTSPYEDTMTRTYNATADRVRKIQHAGTSCCFHDRSPMKVYASCFAFICPLLLQCLEL